MPISNWILYFFFFCSPIDIHLPFDVNMPKTNLSIKARNLCLSVCLSVCLCVCVCICASNISADQDQTDLRVSTWLLRGSRVCNVIYVWTAMLPWINYFRNASGIQQALSTGATTVMWAPEPITAHRSQVRTRANHCRTHPHPPS